MNTTTIIELGGIITFDDMSHLDQSLDPSLMLDNLKEDLFQASFPLGQILDIGWHPELCENGYFRVNLISKFNWDIPIHSENAKNWEELGRTGEVHHERIEKNKISPQETKTRRPEAL